MEYVRGKFVMPMITAQMRGDIDWFNKKRETLDYFFLDSGAHSKFSDAAKNMAATIAWFGRKGVDDIIVEEYLKMIQLIADERYEEIPKIQERIDTKMHRFAYLRNCGSKRD
jgi:hypothetical protein